MRFSNVGSPGWVSKTSSWDLFFGFHMFTFQGKLGIDETIIKSKDKNLPFWTGKNFSQSDIAAAQPLPSCSFARHLVY